MTRYEAFIRAGWRERSNADLCIQLDETEGADGDDFCAPAFGDDAEDDLDFDDEALVLDPDFDSEVRSRLRDRWLGDSAAGLTFPEFSGLVAATYLTPVELPLARLAETITSLRGQALADAAEQAAFLADLQAYVTHVGVIFRELDLLDEGYSLVDLGVEESPDLDDWTPEYMAKRLDALVHWCRGVQRTHVLWPDCWQNAATRQDVQRHLANIASLADPENPAHAKLVAKIVQDPVGNIGEDALALHRKLRRVTSE